MSLKELFPAYPLTLRTPRNSKIRFGSRDLYVDLPWQAYYFLQVAMSKSQESDLTTKEVREEWQKFLQDNKESLTYHGKAIISVSLRYTSFSEKPFLRLDVKWDLFMRYLEEKAILFSSEIDKNGENIMNVYREIWMNFFTMSGETTPFSIEYVHSISASERFKKLLKRTGDDLYLENLLDRFEEIIRWVQERIKNKIPSVQLYTTNLMMSIHNMRALIGIVDIPAAYYILRNLLENFVKVFVYVDIGRNIDPDVVLISMFFYEYEMNNVRELRLYSFKKFRDRLVKIFTKIKETISPENPPSLNEFINKLKEKHLPILRINEKVLTDFSESYSLNIGLGNLYSACSAIIHNQPPLPFFSLLEVKYFKNFLEKYMQVLKEMAEKLVDEKIELKEIPALSLLRDKLFPKECLQVAYLLEIHNGTEVKEEIKEALIVLQDKKAEV